MPSSLPGYVSPEAHARAVREAVRAHGDRIAEAIEEALICDEMGKRRDAEMMRDHAARIARDLTREAIR